MKKLVTILLLLCCFTMIFGLVACKPQPGPNENPDENGQGSTNEGSFFFNGDGSFRYSVIRPDTNSAIVKGAAVNMRKALIETFETESIDISDDWIDDKSITAEQIADYYEILVGKTNRPESEAVYETLTDYTYKICMIGHKIVIVGKDDKATATGVQYFIDTYLKDTSLINESMSYVGEYELHPLDIVLKDTSTGKSTPRVVQTKYPTADVVIADIIPTEDGYAVSNDGMGDSTAGIQKALNDCQRNGGGTVYLPAGVYAISGKISIPAFVTLRGDWQDPDEGTEYGTVIVIYGEGDQKYAAGNEVTEGTFTLGGSGGIVGMTVYYADQTLDNVKSYPFTFYTDGAGVNYMLATLKNVTVLNGYRGLGACCATGGGAHEQLTVENFKGTFLYCGAEVYNQADVGTWQDVVISNKYWKEATGNKIVAADAAKLDAYTKQNAVGLKLGDLEWTEFESLKVSDCSIGIEIMVGKRIQFAGSLLDVEILNCGKGMYIHQLDRRWGMVIARSTIENGIYNYSEQNNAGNVPGMVKLCDVKTTGDLVGEISKTEGTLSSYVIDYKRTYTKPNAVLYIALLDKTGATDVSDALQAKLDEAAATGGVVYLPAGNYRLDYPVSVPAGVELRGASSVAGRDQGGLSIGTVIYCYYGDEAGVKPDTDAALITLAGKNAGLNGVRIVYPENGPYDSNLETTYTVRGKAEGVYVVNCMISASGYGIDFRNCDNHFVQKVTTCCYYNTFRLGGKNGMLNGCLQNGTVIYRTNKSGGFLQNWPGSEAEIWNELFDPITRQYNKYIILDGATDQQVYNSFIYGCANLVVCNNSTAVVANVGSDNIGKNAFQLVMNSGKLVVINSMRYNGKSIEHKGGTFEVYNRITINNKGEDTYVETK